MPFPLPSATRRRLLWMPCLLAWPTVRAAGPEYPNRAVRYVVPYAPGGPTDHVARLLAAELSRRWGVPVQVDNQPGANASRGAELVARAPADGYTLLQGTSSTHASNPVLLRHLPYDAQRDFEPVVGLIEGPVYLGVRADSPLRDTRQLVQLARQRPGELRYATAGPGSPQHLAGELLRRKAGVVVTPVHYRGAAPALAALQRGEVDFYFDSTALQQQRQGRLRVLGVASRERWPQAPHVPTLGEGGVPGVDVHGWFAVFAPRGTPAGTLHRLNADINAALAEPAVHDGIEALGYRVLGGSAKALQERVQREVAAWRQLVEAGLRLE